MLLDYIYIYIFKILKYFECILKMYSYLLNPCTSAFYKTQKIISRL